jgi:cytochrome c553
LGWTLSTLAIAGGAVLVAASLFVWIGLFDVAASTKHSPPVEFLLHFVMRRSVLFHAPELAVPNLNDPSLLVLGALHYAGTCAACHGAPGQLASPVAQQMTPVPPALYSARQDFDPSQLFWIIKNGVKFTAMPAWPTPGRDDEIWAMVAFVEQLPTLTQTAYAALVGDARTSWLPSRPAIAAGFDPSPCAPCHGANGRGRAGIIASIAGRSENELEAALSGYRDGSRPSGIMQPYAATLSDQQVIAAARYYAGLPEASP